MGQAPQVVQHPPARLRPTEQLGNALVDSLNPLGTPPDFRYPISSSHHRLTSSAHSCLNSTLPLNATVVPG